MHRSPALTYFEVADTAQELLLQGINPTQEALKAVLKRGSNTTIVKHLQRWRAEQGSATQLAVKENLPPEVIAAVQTVWQTLIEKADYKIQQFQADANEKIDDLENLIATTQNDFKMLQQSFTELQTAHELLLNQKKSAEQTIQQQQAELIECNAKLNSQAEKITEKQKRIDELNHLHQQAQANLEHSRESVREQRLLDQQRHEQVQIELEQTIKVLRSELAITQQNNVVMQVDFEKVNSVLLQQQQQTSELLQKNQQFGSTLANKEKQINQLEFANAQLENIHISLQTKSAELDLVYNESQKQVAVLAQQLADSNNAKQNMEQQNQLLNDEKWIWMQEKIQLNNLIKNTEPDEVSL